MDTAGLDDESARLVEEYLKEFRQSGIQLDDAGQERLRAVNAELSRLGTEFGQRTKEAMKSNALLLDDAAELSGLPADDVASAAEAARAAGHEGKYLLTLIQPSNQPAMASLENRDVRRRLYQASISRGSSGGSLDVLDLVKSMVRAAGGKGPAPGLRQLCRADGGPPDGTRFRGCADHDEPAGACRRPECRRRGRRPG